MRVLGSLWERCGARAYAPTVIAVLAVVGGLTHPNVVHHLVGATGFVWN
jgi:hypothetical protein